MGRPRLGLRSQLGLLSLLVLLLPLAVLQYVRLVQLDLLQAQRQALQAQLHASAMQLANSERLLQSYFPPPDPAGLRFRPLSARPSLDGSCDDWPLAQSAGEVELVAAYYEGDLFICLRREAIAGEELLRLESDSIRLHYAYGVDGISFGREQTDGGEVLRYETRAAWIAWQNGYQVEVQLPRFLVGNRLGIEIVGEGVATQALFGFQQGLAQRYFLQPAAQESGLNATAGEKLILMTADYHLLASQDRQPLVEQVSPVGWRSSLARLLPPTLDQELLPVADDSGPVQNLPTRQEGVYRYAYAGPKQRPMLVMMRPIDIEGLRIGWLLSMQPARSLNQSNLAALDRLILNSAALFTLVALSFLLYAGWLVRRVRRLERQTARLLVRGSQMAQHRGAGDELSQLSGQFARMVQRLDGYTSYLQGLAGKLSHEIRTPLAIVSSSLDNLEASQDADERAACLSRARQGLQRLDAILGVMAQASSFEQLLDEVELHEFAPLPVVTEVTRAYQHRYPGKAIKLLSRGCDEQDIAWGTPDLLVQALDKLVDNAVDFASGEIRIGLELETGGWTLSVENEGPLLPAAMQANLFDALVSVRDKNADKLHLGFGLQMVKRIAEKLGGQVECHNLADGSGVRFALKIGRAANASG